MSDIEGQVLARAVSQWCRSDAGSKCLNESDLPMRIKLEQAFIAGWEARGEALAAAASHDGAAQERRRGLDRRNLSAPGT